MNAASRPVTAGKARVCPHCKATILESLSICPACLHHLRFDADTARRQAAAKTALRVEGSISQAPLGEPSEYYVVLAVRNDRGDEISRQVMTVGALHPGEQRSFELSVEVLPLQPPPPPPRQPLATEPAGVTGEATAEAAASGESKPQKPRVGGYDLKPPGLKPDRKG